ncbi:MAG: hypothetical protein A3K19_08515 [Lentisphaerae bacterium RIFOXYB12_FULL_65_16]|nr:MAG: hypothetical protein A3K18_21915 [Lentisphaerae bacterium RIFOXYA12_64_32]OGV93431.1 MAG: hypothetical protein A3K19_08515 [Lentisphaerae bacterium RIFOXYB12_FULL_65_16]
MPKTTLGRTGLEVSVLGWGCPGPGVAPGAMEQVWDTYHRCGGNHLDTAAAYGDSEEIIGAQLSQHRRDFIVATKSHPVDADQTLRDIERSLVRLRTDCVDLLYAPHGCRDETQLSNSLRKGGVIEGAVKARERGLTKHLAFSFDYFQPMDIRRLRELIATDVFDVLQLPYCLVKVEPVDEELIPFAREKGMGIVANFPTLSGLTGREWGVFYADFEGLVHTPGQATLLALLCHPQIDCVLTRLSSPERAEENCFAGRRVAAMTPAQKRTVRRRVEARGAVRFLQRDECPPAPPDVAFRHSMIYFDLFTRFGFGGARPVVEQFQQRVAQHPDFPWTQAAREAIDEVKRTCPLPLVKT